MPAKTKEIKNDAAATADFFQNVMAAGASHSNGGPFPPFNVFVNHPLICKLSPKYQAIQTIAK